MVSLGKDTEKFRKKVYFRSRQFHLQGSKRINLNARDIYSEKNEKG